MSQQHEQDSVIWPLTVFYLGFCYVGRAIRVHYGFKVWPPPDSYTLTYLQKDLRKQ
jgi:hypothetical protein